MTAPLPPGHPDPLVSKPVPRAGADPWLRDSEQYCASLRDGRIVIVAGRDVPDVTVKPGLKNGIDTLAGRAAIIAEHRIEQQGS